MYPRSTGVVWGSQGRDESWGCIDPGRIGRNAKFLACAEEPPYGEHSGEISAWVIGPFMLIGSGVWSSMSDKSFSNPDELDWLTDR
jgi:hypothetical protein